MVQIMTNLPIVIDELLAVIDMLHFVFLNEESRSSGLFSLTAANEENKRHRRRPRLFDNFMLSCDARDIQSFLF